MTKGEGPNLLQSLRAGDTEAFTQITQQYGGMVYGVCLRITGNSELARDATQETFYQLLKCTAKVTDSLGGWLHQVATRRAVDLVRQDSARRRREQQFAAEKLLTISSWEEVAPIIDEALAEIEEDDRALLIQRYLVGKTTTDMAVEAGLSQPTMSRRIQAALGALREQLLKKGICIGGALTLVAVMGKLVSELPFSVRAELGKMFLIKKVALDRAIGFTKAKISQLIGWGLTGVVCIVGLFMAPIWESNRSSTPNRAMLPTGPVGGQSFGAASWVISSANNLSLTTPGGVLTRLAALSPQEDPIVLTNCFASVAIQEGFRAMWNDPTTQEQRKMKAIFANVVPPINILQTNLVDGVLVVDWTAIALQGGEFSKFPSLRKMEQGQPWPFKTSLKKIGDEWKIVKF